MSAKPYLKRSKKGIVALGILTSLGISAVGIYQVSRIRTTQVDSKAPPAITTENNAITALGRVEPQGEVINISGPTGERIGQLLVKEGQMVKVGQPLVYLVSHQERLAEKNLAVSELAEAQASLAAETAFGQAQIQEARSRIKQERTPKSAEIAAQRSTVQGLAAELAAAHRDLQRFQQLQRQGAVPQKDLDDRALAVRSKQEELKSAKATLMRLTQEQSTNLENTKAQLQSAQAGLARSKTQVKVESASQKLKLAQARLEQTIVRAPKNGQILEVVGRSGEAITEEGILQIGDTHQMVVIAEVYETDIGKVKVGQSATITSNALPASIQGMVRKIGLKIDKNDVLSIDPAADTDTRVVEVEIWLENSRPVSKLINLQVDVAIQL